MLRRLALTSLTVFVLLPTTMASAQVSGNGNGACFRSQDGQDINCGGGYVIGQPGYSDSARPSTNSAPSNRPRPVLVQFVANGPTGPCLALGPPSPNANATVTTWFTSLNLPPCPATPIAPSPIDPQLLAQSFWRTIPLPIPRPTVPPGYAITGMPAYLVTNSTTAPAPYVFPTPLGQLRIDGYGEYLVDWGDPRSPGWTGPFPFEGQAWPNGKINHTYDDVGTVNIVVREVWNARWVLGGASGRLGGLATSATIPNYRIHQEEAVITN